MRFKDLSDIGGFLWWILVKFCNTDLKDERTDDKWGRNIFTLLIIGTFIGYFMNLIV